MCILLSLELLLTSGENLSVEIPTPDCLLGEKLTAFAPHTTGILLGSGKEIEIAKQLFDIAILSDHLSDYDLFAKTYESSLFPEVLLRNVKPSIFEGLDFVWVSGVSKPKIPNFTPLFV